MADIKISELANATSLDETDLLAGVNAGSTKKFTLARIRDFLKVAYDAAYAAKEHDHNRLYNGTYQVGMPADLKRNETLALKSDLAAASISYDHSNSKLQAEDTQAAVDELAVSASDQGKAIENMKEPLEAATKHVQTEGNPHKTTADDVGAVSTEKVGAAKGVAGLDDTGIVPVEQLPIFVSEISLAVENMTLSITATASRK